MHFFKEGSCTSQVFDIKNAVKLIGIGGQGETFHPDKDFSVNLKVA